MKRLGALWLGACGMLLQPAAAELRIDVHQSGEGRIPIAVLPFDWADAARVDTLSEVVVDDLQRSGLFQTLELRAMPQRELHDAQFDYDLWRESPAEYAVTARLTMLDAGQIQADYRLHDVAGRKVVAGERMQAPLALARRMAHRLADAVHERLTGVRGAFDTRIAYVSREPESRDYRLLVADSDGHGAVTLLTVAQPLLAPAWAPDGRELAYVSFERGRPQVFVHDLATGARRAVPQADIPAMAPAYSPDGVYLALSVPTASGADLYLYHRRDRSLLRMTRSRGIDTEPAWSADSKSLLFTSDRKGRPRIFRQPLQGGAAEALPLPGRYSAGASASPVAPELALVHVGDGGEHGIYLYNRQIGLRRLTRSVLDESPSFAPNGAALIYASTDAQSRRVLIWSSRDGRIKRRLRLQQTDAREPSWSPYLN